MISSELRIGNIVQSVYNDTFGISQETLCDFANGYVNLKPITLTEEWLKKFGFDFSVDTWYLNGVAIWETECCGAKGNEEIGFFYELRDVGMMDMNIKYVHQLQNLYFALTGKELIIK